MSKVLIHLIVSFDKLAFSNKLKYVESPISKMRNDKYRVQFRAFEERRNASSSIFASKKFEFAEKSNLWILLSIFKVKMSTSKVS